MDGRVDGWVDGLGRGRGKAAPRQVPLPRWVSSLRRLIPGRDEKQLHRMGLFFFPGA